MDIVNQKVRHGRFGEGVVVEQHSNELFVEFESGDTIRFAYPAAFEKFLTAEDERVQNGIIDEIKKNIVDIPYAKPLITVTPSPIGGLGGAFCDNILRVGDTWQGFSCVDMINKIFKTSHKGWMKALYPLDNFGHAGKSAWFVFMDGTAHGSGDDLWKNFLCDGGQTIKEQFVGAHIENFYAKMSKGVPCRHRAAFRRDPDNTGNIYKCEFVGYFEMKTLDNKNGLRVYDKKQDSLMLK